MSNRQEDRRQMTSPELDSWTKRITSRTRDLLKRHSTVLMLAITYGTTRLLGGLFLQLTFAGYGPAVGHFRGLARLAMSDAYPFIGYWDAYPPMYPWMNTAAYLLSILLPGDQVLWFGTFQRWAVVPFDVGGVILVYLIARRLDASEHHALRVSLLYVVAFITLYVPLGWFDSLPLFWLLLTLYCAIAYRPAWCGIAASLGFLSKPIPVLALPMAWQRLSSKSARLKLAAAALAAALITTLPFVLINADMSLAYLRTLVSRSSYETIWALIDGYHSFGAAAPIERRFDPSSATWVAHPGGGGYGLWVLVGFGVLYVYLWTRRIDWHDDRRATAFACLTWCLFALWSRGYSPQWSINFVPFVALLMPNVRGAVYLMLLSVGLVAEWPGAFVLLRGQEWYLAAIVIWRTALAVLLTLEFGALALANAQGVRKLRLVCSGLVGVLIVAGLAIGVLAMDRYFDLELAIEPLRSTVDRLRSEPLQEAGLVCREIEVCERISPYVPQLAMYWVPGPDGRQAERLAEFASRHPLLWLVEEYDSGSGHDLSTESWLSERYGKASQEWIDGTRVSRFVSADLPVPEPAQVSFGDQFVLSDYALGVEGRYLNLALTWETMQPTDVPYKPFVHVVGSDGQIIAQSDQYPVGGFMPPDEWQPQSAVWDLHGIILPEDAPEQYAIRVGWYDPNTGARLPIEAPSDLKGEQSFEIWTTR
jgi:hypothetical protein